MLWSVGHGARSLDAFLAILHAAGIRRVVDVRTAPGSRLHPQFGKDELARSLEAAGISYAWRKDLGGWRTPRADSPHSAIRNRSFRGYADHMDTEEFRAALSWLIETSARLPTAFLCSESLWWRCHRRMIADALTVRGVEVRHLMDGGREETHRLHPAARAVGERLIYDVEGPEQRTLA